MISFELIYPPNKIIITYAKTYIKYLYKIKKG